MTALKMAVCRIVGAITRLRDRPRAEAPPRLYNRNGGHFHGF